MTAAKRRAARGGGSVYYDANARRWAASVTITDGDGRRSRRKMTAPDKATAQLHLKQMLAERDTTGRVARKDYTVGHALDDLLRHPPASWKSPITRKVNAQLAGRLRHGLGSVLLARLTVGQIGEHLRREVSGNRPLARRTVRDELALLRRAIRRAQQHDLASRNVADLADMPAGAHTRRSGAMTIPQVRQLLGSDLTPFWRAWLSVALLLGLRPGEVSALSWDDADLAAGALHVRHSLHQSPQGLVPGPLKTEQSRRTHSPLPVAVTDALVAWAAEQAEQQRLAGAAWEGTGLVFTNGFGRPVNRQRLHREFRAACEAAGIARPDGTAFQLRECRHSWVSVLSAGGVDIEVIADAAGHINSNVTRTVYRQQITDKTSAAATVMDRIFEAGATP